MKTVLRLHGFEVEAGEWRRSPCPGAPGSGRGRRASRLRGRPCKSGPL